jgi:hypothetical protein
MPGCRGVISPRLKREGTSDYTVFEVLRSFDVIKLFAVPLSEPRELEVATND